MKLNTSSPLAGAGRWLAAAALAATAVVVPGLAAHADVPAGTSVWVGDSIGYGGTSLHEVYAPVPTDTSNPGTPDYWAYCIEHDVSAKSHITATAADMSSYLGANLFTDPAVQGKVLWVLAHSYPALSLADFGTASGVPGISVNDAIEATQYAIWRYTDLGWDAAWNWENDDSKTAYWYLVNGANASSGMTPADFVVTAAITGPAAAQSADSLVGPFTVTTNQTTVSVTTSPAVALTDATGAPIDAGAVVDGQQLYLDLRGSTAAGSATVTVTAAGTSATGLVLSSPKSAGGTATADSHAQSLILVTPTTTRTSVDATVQWAAKAAPSIGTTLVDASDQDHVLAWGGGTLTDTIDYHDLTPGTTYTVAGELVRKSDGTSTGITGTTTFTPTTANGTTTVTFTVSNGYDGQALVAYEELYTGTTTTGTPVATHKDLTDTAQTITVNDKPKVPTTPPDHGTTHPGHGTTPSDNGKPQPDNGTTLASTGGAAPLALGGLAVLTIVAGATLFAVRRRTRS